MPSRRARKMARLAWKPWLTTISRCWPNTDAGAQHQIAGADAGEVAIDRAAGTPRAIRPARIAVGSS